MRTQLNELSTDLVNCPENHSASQSVNQSVNQPVNELGTRAGVKTGAFSGSGLLKALVLVLGLVLTALVAPQTVFAQFDDAQRISPEGQAVTRNYAEVEGLQIHYREARPPSGVTPRRPVIALHQSPNSGQVYVEFMSLLAADRRVIAPDTPGFGQSDRPLEAPSIADYARWMDGLADALGLEAVDLVGYHTGASIAVEWAIANPQRVQRLWLVGLPAFNAEERARLAKDPWPNPAPLDALRVAEEWKGSKRWQGPGQSDASVERTFLAKLGSGRQGWWGPAAVFAHDFLGRLGLVEQRVAVVRPKDDLWDITQRVRTALPHIEVVDVPDRGFAVFEVDPERMAGMARQALDQPETP